MSVLGQEAPGSISIVTTVNNVATSIIHKASSTVISIQTDSNGCVICEGTVNCPDCADDEYCVMTSLTCTSCPYTYCVPKNDGSVSGVLTNSTLGNGTTRGLNFSDVNKNSTSHYGTVHKIQGAVVGTVIGFVCIMLIIWYSFYWRKKKRLAKARELADKTYNTNDVDVLELADIDEDDIYDSDDDIDEFEEDMTNNVDTSNNNTNNNNNTWNSNRNSNYNGSIMTPSQRLQYINEIRSIKHRNLRNETNNLSIISNRASSASNILPIGYIPGVTSTSTMNSGIMRNHNPLKNLNSKSNLSTYNNHLNIVGDIRSHITLGSSILEDISEDIEDNISTYINNLQSPPNTANIIKSSSGSSLTTAIKGRPKLVQINESKEIEGYEDADTDNESIKGKNQSSKSSNDNITSDRYSMRSDITGTGSYILDFEINPLNTKLQPPIPAANKNNITNKLFTINDLKRSSKVTIPLRNNRNSIDDSEDISIATSDMVIIDTKAADNPIEDNSINQQEQGNNIFSDKYEII